MRGSRIARFEFVKEDAHRPGCRSLVTGIRLGLGGGEVMSGGHGSGKGGRMHAGRVLPR